MNTFKIIKNTSQGRLGILTTSKHGSIMTPAFVFCATKAAIKGATPKDLLANQTQCILANTYNLLVNPGPHFIKEQGGLHALMNWSKPIFTDSGGFQIFSMGYGSVAQEIKGKRQAQLNWVKVTEEGAQFTSYYNGNKIRLTPENSIYSQFLLGADFIFTLDECTPYHISKDSVAKSMHRSHRWEMRSICKFNSLESSQGLYGIVQGGIYEDLRLESIDFVNQQKDFFGIGIGGSLGVHSGHMCNILNLCRKHLIINKPRHLLGIGRMQDILLGVAQGIDTFDCVHPTRIARHGAALVGPERWIKTQSGYREHIILTNSKYKELKEPIDKDCQCYTCKSFSMGYIHYLLKAKEMLGIMLLLQHNIYVMNHFMCNIREAIKSNTFHLLKKRYLL